MKSSKLRILGIAIFQIIAFSAVVTGQNPGWPSGATDYFTIPASAQGDNEYHIAVIGDSIAWGNGLAQTDKYYYKVAEMIGTQLNVPVEVTVFAHSGAVISNPDPFICSDLGCPSPTLMDQAKNINDGVNLILISGGINDVGINNILDVSTPEDDIGTLSKSIEDPMTDLLMYLKDKTDAKMIVTGYYPIITDESKLGLTDRGIDLILSMFSEKSINEAALTATVSTATPQGGAIMGAINTMQTAADNVADAATGNSKLMANSYTFSSVSSDSLRFAAEKADNLEKRIVFVDPFFNNANSYKASDTLLSDNVIDLKSIAHPTARGAMQYADRINIAIHSSGGSEWLLGYNADNLIPVVHEFQVTPIRVTFDESFTIDYTVSRNNGPGLKQVELWRKDETSDWQEIDRYTLMESTDSYGGSFTDTPSVPGIYWYGIHVVDNAGNWNDEKNSNTNYQPNGFEPVQVEVKEAGVAKDYTELEQKSIEKTREVLDAYISLTSTGSALSYGIVDAKSFESKTDAARYLNDAGLTYESTLETLNIIDVYGLESTGFCLVVVEYDMVLFGQSISLLSCAVCDENGKPIGYDAFQGLMQGYS